LARAYAESNLLYESYIARAEYHYLRGNLAFAIQQLDNAKGFTSNEILLQEITDKKNRFRQEQLETEAAFKNL
jgi:predicted Zn-dependent protease